MDNQINNQEPIESTPVINSEPIVNQEPIVPVQEPKQDEPTLSDFGIVSKPPQNKIFKVIFIFSLILFILIVVAFSFVYYQSKNNSSLENKKSSSEISSTPTIASGACFLNDKTYNVGDSFAAVDGCNTCTCESQDTITCTENECLKTSP